MADPLVELAERLQAQCLARGLTVATAESCTGGLVAHLITEVPGSSAYLAGGIVAYSNAVKTRQLGVPEDVLEAHGAVSAQVAIAMAEGARDRLRADLGVGVTGRRRAGRRDRGEAGGARVRRGGRAGRRRWCGDSCGRATGPRTSVTRPGRRSRCCSSAPWTAARSVSGRPRRPDAPGERARGGRMTVRGAAEVGAGLAPARAPRPIAAGERIHVVGAAGAGASAAALLASWAGARGRRLRPRRSEPVHARRSTPPASASRRATIRRTSPASAGPRGSPSPRRSRRSTRATPSWPRRGRPASRSRRGSRSSRTPRPAGGWSGSPGRTARARRRAGWSTCWRRPAGIPGRSSGPCCRRP